MHKLANIMMKSK